MRSEVASVRAMDGNQRPSGHKALTDMDRISADFVSAVLVWTLFGWLADRWLGTDPWLVALGAVLGFTLGMYLVWLRAIRPEED